MDWIAVKFALPMHIEEEYLVSDGEFIDIYKWAPCRKTGRKWAWKDQDGFDMEVTYWMPLPERPKDE